MKLVLLLAVVAVVAGWFGGPLVHPTSAPTSASRPGRQPLVAALGPIALSSERFKAEARMLGQPMYWAGPAKGDRYELTRLSSDRLFIRYLPRGLPPGAPGARFLIVATYPFPQAYKALKRVARGGGAAGPGGSFVLPRPNDPRSVLLAFPGLPYEVELFDPSPARALALAESGNVRPVG
jgi:hypothetical protein